jgi:hypothetical protein
VMSGLLAGCADYLNRYDTVTLAAGDTQKYNALLQTKDPFNPASKDTAITTDANARPTPSSGSTRNRRSRARRRRTLPSTLGILARSEG